MPLLDPNKALERVPLLGGQGESARQSLLLFGEALLRLEVTHESFHRL